MMRLYREFSTQEELDREYNPSASVPGGATIMQAWQERSAAARARLDHMIDVRYGPTLAEYADVFPAAPGSPVHLFVHGGYWRRYTARDFDFVAEGLVAAGITAVIVNYALCPAVTLDEIVRQVRAATAWTHKKIDRFGGDAERLTVSGHSAGGHLVGMLLATDWAGEYGLPADIIKGALPISGLFDLAPFPFTYLQPSLQLTWDQVRRNSPLDLAPRVRCPTLVAVGGSESAEFRRQSAAYADKLRSSGRDARLLEVPGAHHFSILEGFDRPDAAFVKAIRSWSER